MSIIRRFVTLLAVLTLLAGAGLGVAYGMDLGSVRDTTDRVLGHEDTTPAAAAPTKNGPKASPSETPDPVDPVEPSEDPTTAAPEPEPSATEEPEPSETPDPTAPAEPSAPEAGTPLLVPGAEGDAVRDLQARLRQIYWFNQDVTGFYGDVTTEAVRGFQAKRGIAVTGKVDQTTMDRLLAMTTEPTDAELTNQIEHNVPGALDPRCETGHVVCVDKTSRTLRWVVDGKVKRTMDVRFGSEYTPTREGAFTVQYKNRDHVSSLYGSSMPFAMFFSGGQAVHYSSDFAARGYDGASHGCVNVRDYDAIEWLFDQVDVGDPVIVYRS